MLADFLKTLPQYLIPKKKLTLFAGMLANVKSQAIKNWLIQRFVKQYGVNMKEALEEDPCAYETFNQFFIRLLKPECRPLAATKIVSPIDGIISEIGSIQQGKLLQAKGWYYSVQELLACDSEVSSQFHEGVFATFYLSPKDYHRVHMPAAGRLQQMTYVPGKLFSVQPATVRTIPRLFSRNERVITFFETSFGPMAVVLVGATIVGRIGISWHGEITRSNDIQQFDYRDKSINHQPMEFKKGEELGYFKLGSTVIILFPKKGTVKWLDTLKSGDKIAMGEALID